MIVEYSIDYFSVIISGSYVFLNAVFVAKSRPDKIIEHKFVAEGRCDRIGVFAISRFESRELLVT